MTQEATTTHASQSPAGPPTAWGMLALLGGPLAWAVHIGARYPLVLLACEEGSEWPLHAVSIGCAVASVGALALALVVIRRSRDEGGPRGEDDELARTRLRRMRFLGRAGVLTAVLFLATILTEALPTLFYDPCLMVSSS